MYRARCFGDNCSVWRFEGLKGAVRAGTRLTSWWHIFLLLSRLLYPVGRDWLRNYLDLYWMANVNGVVPLHLQQWPADVLMWHLQQIIIAIQRYITDWCRWQDGKHSQLFYRQINRRKAKGRDPRIPQQLYRFPFCFHCIKLMGKIIEFSIHFYETW